MSIETTTPSSPFASIGRLESLLQLCALTSFAIAHPMLDSLGRFSEFLVAHQLRPNEIVLLAVALVVAIPLALWLTVQVAAQLSHRFGEQVHLLFVGFLTALWALPILTRAAELTASLVISLALLIGGLVVWLLRRFVPARTFMSIGAIAGLGFAYHFLMLSPASRLLDAAQAQPPASLEGGRLQQPPVVLVIFDELPLGSLLTIDGEIDAERFPNFAALAFDAAFYTQATAAASTTAYAVPAILTGRYPQGSRVPTYLDYPQNLFTLFGGSYQIHARESLTQLCPEEICQQDRPPPIKRLNDLVSDLKIIYPHLVLPVSLTERLPSITGTWRDFDVDWKPSARGGLVGVERIARLDIPGLVQTYVEGIGVERNVLHYLHLELPHVPWRYLPSGIAYGPVGGSRPPAGLRYAGWIDDDWLITLALQRHLAQAMFADRVLGQLIVRLRDRGLYEDAVLIVTADHGIAFLAGEPIRTFTEKNVSEVVTVPLIVRSPGAERGARYETPVEVIDILPTLADAAGVDLPWKIDGRSLLDSTYKGRNPRQPGVSGEDLRLSITSQEVATSKHVAARRIAAAFPAPGVDGLFRIGSHPDLLNRTTAEVVQRVTGKVEAAVTHPWLYSSVEPDSGFLPARVDGRLLSGDRIDRRRPVAISVNGVIRAVTRSYPARKVERFSALLPEISFIAGENRVEIFVVENTADGSPVLVPAVDRSGPTYHLLRASDGELLGIEATNGTGCRLTSDAVTGEARRDGFSFEGWALDPTGTSPTVIIMAFFDDTLVWAGPTGAKLPADNEATKNQAYATSGFRFSVTRPLLPRGESSELRLFGVMEDRCSVLTVVEGN